MVNRLIVFLTISVLVVMVFVALYVIERLP